MTLVGSVEKNKMKVLIACALLLVMPSVLDAAPRYGGNYSNYLLMKVKS